MVRNRRGGQEGFDPLHPFKGYMWIINLRSAIRKRIGTDWREHAALENFLHCYYEFARWDGLLMRLRAGVLNSVEVEDIVREGISLGSDVQIKARRDAQWQDRQTALQCLFPDGLPDWMAPLLDWRAQMRSTDGY